MKDDPFAQVGGLDQALFKQQDNATTLPPSNESTKEPARQRTKEETIASSKPRVVGAARKPQFVLSPQRLLEAKRTRASGPTGHLTAVRAVERHSHDIYLDQIRWMNRVKLEILETYGTKVTNNEMVQLAVDLFRADFDNNGDESQLMRVLVMGEQPDLEGGGP